MSVGFFDELFQHNVQDVKLLEDLPVRTKKPLLRFLMIIQSPVPSNPKLDPWSFLQVNPRLLEDAVSYAIAKSFWNMVCLFHHLHQTQRNQETSAAALLLHKALNMLRGAVYHTPSKMALILSYEKHMTLPEREDFMENKYSTHFSLQIC